ncbi:hypothetical protein BHE74_00028877 [Ensete ventricosum]|nr:hypothetical protein BHE74_00028877 [Ensete ventricosum]
MARQRHPVPEIIKIYRFPLSKPSQFSIHVQGFKIRAGEIEAAAAAVGRDWPSSDAATPKTRLRRCRFHRDRSAVVRSGPGRGSDECDEEASHRIVIRGQRHPRFSLFFSLFLFLLPCFFFPCCTQPYHSQVTARLISAMVEIDPFIDITPSAARVESLTSPQQKGYQPISVSFSSGQFENSKEFSMADASPRTDTSTDVDTDDKDKRLEQGQHAVVAASDSSDRSKDKTLDQKLLANQLEPLTEQQMMGICNLQQSSQQAEDALSQGMEALQQSLAETLAGSLAPAGSSGNVANYMGQMAMAMGKLGTLENFLRQVNYLRLLAIDHYSDRSPVSEAVGYVHRRKRSDGRQSPQFWAAHDAELTEAREMAFSVSRSLQPFCHVLRLQHF